MGVYYDDNSINVKKKNSDQQWKCLDNVDDVKMQNIMNFVEKVNVDRDRIGKKKVNIKFYNAQKKFSKKIIPDKKNDFIEILKKEEY
jgi:hypothetical protein